MYTASKSPSKQIYWCSCKNNKNAFYARTHWTFIARCSCRHFSGKIYVRSNLLKMPHQQLFFIFFLYFLNSCYNSRLVFFFVWCPFLLIALFFLKKITLQVLYRMVKQGGQHFHQFFFFNSFNKFFQQIYNENLVDWICGVRSNNRKKMMQPNDRYLWGQSKHNMFSNHPVTNTQSHVYVYLKQSIETNKQRTFNCI